MLRARGVQRRFDGRFLSRSVTIERGEASFLPALYGTVQNDGPVCSPNAPAPSPPRAASAARGWRLGPRTPGPGLPSPSNSLPEWRRALSTLSPCSRGHRGRGRRPSYPETPRGSRQTRMGAAQLLLARVVCGPHASGEGRSSRECAAGTLSPSSCTPVRNTTKCSMGDSNDNQRAHELERYFRPGAATGAARSDGHGKGPIETPQVSPPSRLVPTETRRRSDRAPTDRGPHQGRVHVGCRGSPRDRNQRDHVSAP